MLGVLALDPVRDLLKSVDRTPIRSLLKLGRLVLSGENQAANPELQTDLAWTISRPRWAPTPTANGRAGRSHRVRALGNNELTLSRAPHVAESPTRRTSATRDETRAIDQRGATRDARRDSGGRRTSGAAGRPTRRTANGRRHLPGKSRGGTPRDS